eukprot:CAMPEP_0195566124 /NCGR_PEP_ID=MMETSP0814-20130614/880_1 /TAXON_ID=97485 /ORGANISM="Prymnesium parvum, Strain Texoma1" /LENGTH=83 /DNA_ID=CAMNT_0040701207 /DNA_START=152 /DNA_END=400 /DNA_ORIENTATION=-
MSLIFFLDVPLHSAVENPKLEDTRQSEATKSSAATPRTSASFWSMTMCTSRWHARFFRACAARARAQGEGGEQGRRRGGQGGG